MQDVNVPVWGFSWTRQAQCRHYLYRASPGVTLYSQELWQVLVTQLLGGALLSLQEKITTLIETF